MSNAFLAGVLIRLSSLKHDGMWFLVTMTAVFAIYGGTHMISDSPASMPFILDLVAFLIFGIVGGGIGLAIAFAILVGYKVLTKWCAETARLGEHVATRKTKEPKQKRSLLDEL
ncbi:hypothetical protein E4H12_01865 [Candidatus Thorarchaeota archaeon]|nr:MAG: hypothetical protein E4H12_01865 [Candidatus Thorarchaeota archaeon]